MAMALWILFTLIIFGLATYWVVVLVSGEKHAYERIRREGTRYVAVIKDLGQIRTGQSQMELMLKIETPSGPVGKRLFVPLQGAVTHDFLITARVTDRPVYVQCILDAPSNQVASLYGIVLEERP